MVPVEATGPVFSPVQGVDVVGCRFCAALRELVSFPWSSDPVRLNRVMDDGGCYPAAPGVAFARIEYGDGVSLFRMVLPPEAGLGSMPPLWFRNADMTVDGSNELPNASNPGDCSKPPLGIRRDAGLPR
jgi:hypothetical protein